jgi:hypothetical protein
METAPPLFILYLASQVMHSGKGSTPQQKRYSILYMTIDSEKSQSEGFFNVFLKKKIGIANEGYIDMIPRFAQRRRNPPLSPFSSATPDPKNTSTIPTQECENLDCTQSMLSLVSSRESTKLDAMVDRVK